MANLFRGRCDWVVADTAESAADHLANVYGYASGDEYLSSTGDRLLLISPDYDLSVVVDGEEQTKLASDWVLSPPEHFRIATGS